MCFFADAKLGGDLIHGDGPDAVTHEQVGRFFQYSFFMFHITTENGHKTKETFFVTKVSTGFFMVFTEKSPDSTMIVCCFKHGLRRMFDYFW